MPANLFDAYVAGTAKAFFAGDPRDADERRRAVARAAQPLSPRVRAALEAQNARYGPSPARAAALEALASGAAAVVTGQQVGLFLGPLFTLYKVASAVRVARALARESGRAVVPVFWLQSEDHDLPEIASCTVPRTAHEPLRLSLPASDESRVSIAHLTLPESIDECLGSLRAELGNLPHASEHLERLGRHYRAGASWTDAFAGVLSELFEPEGLVCIDPRDPVLAAELRPLHADAFGRAAELAATLLARSAALEQAGFESVVHVREAAPLAFFHARGADSPRHRLVPCDEGYREVGGDQVYSASALMSELERDPLCFSTSALLRPIAQDWLLPTAAYVAGPAELAYYAQLGPLYEAFRREPPLVVPRARFRLIEPATARLLDKLALGPDAAARPEAELLRELAVRDGAGLSPTELEQRLVGGFDAVLEPVLAELGPLRASIERSADKTRDKLRGSAHKLAEKYADALARQDESRVHDVRRLRLALQPDGVPQERYFGLPYFAARYGDRALVERVLGAIDPFDGSLRELSL